MGENEKKKLQETILGLEKDISKTQQMLNEMKENLEYLKDIAWDRNSKKESSSMYKVLNDEKQYTKVKSNVGEVKVDREFMEKEIKKHLDDPALRGMVTSQEMLSFPKVAKNVDANFNPQQQGYDWEVRANDGAKIVYGERDFGEGHKLLTSHSKTERGERGHSHRQINDPDFHNSVYGENSTTNSKQSQAQTKEAKIQAMKEKARKASEKNLSKNDERGLEK